MKIRSANASFALLSGRYLLSGLEVWRLTEKCKRDLSRVTNIFFILRRVWVTYTS